jgi:hypothetical protein
MNQTLAVTKIEAVEEIGPGIFEVRVLLEDASTATLRMSGYTLCTSQIWFPPDEEQS